VFATLVAEQGQGQSAGKGSADQGVGAGLPVFGEMAMIDRSTRMAAAVTATATKLLVLPVEQFAACMLLVPDIKSRLRRLKDVRLVTNARQGT
jgi:CRP-like cAMP-binding protein